MSRRSHAVLFSSALAALGTLAAAGTAHATQILERQWVPLTSGCASAIAVGPNNVPWMLGCDNNVNPNPVGKPQHVYYHKTVCPTGSGVNLAPCQDEWIQDGNQTGMTLTVNVNGKPFVADASGAIYSDEGATCGSCSTWTPQPTSQWLQYAPGAVGRFAVAADNNWVWANSEWWYPQNGHLEFVGPNGIEFSSNQYWGLGCGSICKNGPFRADEGLYTMTTDNWSDPLYSTWSGGWSQLPGAASDIALFTDPNMSQTPWVINAEGNVYYWNIETSNWTQQPVPYGLKAQSITDHYIVADGFVFEWQGWADGQPPAGQANGFTEIMAPQSAPNGATLLVKQIASAQAVPGSWGLQTAAIGPSELWGIDTNGNIYTSQWVWVGTPIAPK